MTSADTVVQAKRSLVGRIAERAGGGVVQVALVLIGLFWLMPTAGLLLSSLRDPSQVDVSGWW